MPASDSLQPPLTPAERAICKSYGGWTAFLQAFGLKPWNDEDAAEGKAILAGLAAQDEAGKKLKFQHIMEAAQREEPDNEIRAEPELRRWALPAPVSPRILKALMSSNERNTTQMESPPPPPYPLRKPRATAAADDGGGVKEYADAEVGSAQTRLDEEDLLLCYAATAVALPESESEDGNGDDEDDDDDDEDEQGGDGDGARLVPKPTTSGGVTAAAAAAAAAGVESEREGIFDRHLINAALQRIEISSSDGHREVNTCTLPEPSPAEPSTAVPSPVVSDTGATALKQDVREEKASTCWHKSDYDSDPESEHQVEGLTNDAHDNNKDMRSRNTLEEELLRGEIKEEQDGEQVDDEDEDERVTEIITTTTTTTTQPSSATSIPTPFTTEEMVGLAEILSSCPPPRGSNRGPRYTWAKARWEHWSLVDRVFYLAASQY
ncbi:hypothetical protein ISF_06223 [Cordyceps fumosorosea ARSEF 2679]|uniref:Uncharacterized protein n=1 Tax=Cordyceps fumosorosea (strain ARSEF 2679) TaxID=1081104 RepID=A0A167S5W2_CORFA|nr:hypothetical protein ISF_06223 [Cordyceps fumosorosea ARSEF 2679]OAA59288.1 hypothetical protein ISF_06223 [Cordyceps fumosorosea ARSEF 2679]